MRSCAMVGLVFVAFSSPLPVRAAQVPAPARLKLAVLEGEGAINNISLHRAKEPVVQVLDENGVPVKGASVTFLLPETGPGGEFGGGLRLLDILTDEKGEAVGRGLVPNEVEGRFQIRAVASFQGETASAVINQTNAAPAEADRSKFPKKIWLIGAIGGAAAAGVALAARGHGGSAASPAASPAAIVITSGPPGFQPPH